MKFIRSNTAVIITVGPFYDKTDGVTIENALTATNERITLTADTDDGSAPTLILDNITGAAAATANDIVVITGGDAGLYQIELAAANVNRVGRMFLSITDAANHVPVFHELFVLPAAIYDWLTGVIVPLPANVTTIAGSAVSTTTAQLGVNTVQAGGTAWGSGAITAGSIATDAIGAAELAADAATEIANAVWALDASGQQTAGTFGQAIGDPGADTTTIYQAVVTDAAGTHVAADIIAMKAETAAILVDTGTTLDDFIDTEIATLIADVDDIQARLPAALSAAGNMKSDVLTVNTVATAAARLALSTQGIVFCTVGAASSTTSIVTSAMDPAAAVADQFKGRIVTFQQGTTTTNLKGQSTDITASSAAGVLTVTALTNAPVSGDTFIIT